MDIDTKEPGFEPVREAVEGAELADEELYPRLKTLQRQVEFLGIQVRCCGAEPRLDWVT